MAKTATERSNDRDQRHRNAGLVKASAAGWVRAEDHVPAKAAMRKALAKFIRRAEAVTK